jgi:hypothetical protein
MDYDNNDLSLLSWCRVCFYEKLPVINLTHRSFNRTSLYLNTICRWNKVPVPDYSDIKSTLKKFNNNNNKKIIYIPKLAVAECTVLYIQTYTHDPRRGSRGISDIPLVFIIMLIKDFKLIFILATKQSRRISYHISFKIVRNKTVVIRVHLRRRIDDTVHFITGDVCSHNAQRWKMHTALSTALLRHRRSS